MLDITEATCFPCFQAEQRLAADACAIVITVLAALIPAKLTPVSCLFKRLVQANC